MGKARVLAVDDQRYFRELIAGLLGEEGYEVETASTGEEALHLLERHDYDVVVTDLVMPGLDGSELCRRIKDRWPDQAIVMVTGVVDVQTAVSTMKLGATDYILKPFDRDTLIDSLQTILQRRRLREEHAQLMEENLEYMGALSVYERAVGLFSTLATGPLAERLVEGLCLETRAQGGVAWLAEGPEGGRLELAAARGLVRTTDQPRELSLGSLAPAIQTALEAGTVWAGEDAPSESQPGPVLWVPIRNGNGGGAGTALLGAVRVSDPLEGEAFGAAERAHAEQFAGFGATAVSNALRFRSLERRSFRDSITKAYTEAYFQDVVRNEIQKASRFGRSFSLVRWKIRDFDEVRRSMSESQRARWLESLLAASSRALRSTDLLAVCGEDTFAVLLPETDALGASRGVDRIRKAVAKAPPEGPAPRVALAAATYPGDGAQLEALERTLERRVAAAEQSLLGELEQRAEGFCETVGRLLADAEAAPAEGRARIERFVVEDFARRSHERGVLFVAPPAETLDAVTSWLEAAGGETDAPARSEVVVLGASARRSPNEDATESGTPGSIPVTRLDASVMPRPESQSFLLYYGEGPAYAMLADTGRSDGRVATFHTRDRALVEHLALQLQHELGVGIRGTA